MKLIIAYIQPEKLDLVKQALYEKEIFNISVSIAHGSGHQKGYHESYRGAEIEVNLLNKVRLEIAVNDAFKPVAIDAILKATHIDSVGDGKIFVIALEECIRIRTGETGPAAIGGVKTAP